MYLSIFSVDLYLPRFDFGITSSFMYIIQFCVCLLLYFKVQAVSKRYEKIYADIEKLPRHYAFHFQPDVSTMLGVATSQSPYLESQV